MRPRTLLILAVLSLGMPSPIDAGTVCLHTDDATLTVLDVKSYASSDLHSKSTTQINLITTELPFTAVAAHGSDVELALPNSANRVASSPDTTIAAAGLHPVGLMVAMATTATIPEPSTVVLMGLGAAGMLFAAMRRRPRA